MFSGNVTILKENSFRDFQKVGGLARDRLKKNGQNGSSLEKPWLLNFL